MDRFCAVCLDLVDAFSSSSPQVAQAFYQQYFLTIVQEVFYVMTDSEHKSGFSLQASVLSKMFKIVNQGGVPISVLDPSADPSMSSTEFFQGYCVKLLSGAFPHVHV